MDRSCEWIFHLCGKLPNLLGIFSIRTQNVSWRPGSSCSEFLIHQKHGFVPVADSPIQGSLYSMQPELSYIFPKKDHSGYPILSRVLQVMLGIIQKACSIAGTSCEDFPNLCIAPIAYYSHCFATSLHTFEQLYPPTTLNTTFHDTEIAKKLLLLSSGMSCELCTVLEKLYKGNSLAKSSLSQFKSISIKKKN